MDGVRNQPAATPPLSTQPKPRTVSTGRANRQQQTQRAQTPAETAAQTNARNIEEARQQEPSPSNPTQSAAATAHQSETAASVTGPPVRQEPEATRTEAQREEPKKVGIDGRTGVEESEDGRNKREVSERTEGGKKYRTQTDTKKLSDGSLSQTNEVTYDVSEGLDKKKDKKSVETRYHEGKIQRRETEVRKGYGQGEVVETKSESFLNGKLNHEQTKNNETGQEVYKSYNMDGSLKYESNKNAKTGREITRSFEYNGEIDSARITQKNEDGSKFELHRFGDNGKYIQVEGQGKISAGEFNDVMKGVPGADKFSEALKSGSYKDVQVSKADDGSAVFTVKDSHGNTHTFTAGDKYPRSNTYEERRKYGDSESVKTHRVFIDDRKKAELTSEKNYRNGELSRSEEKTTFRDKSTEERKFFRSGDRGYTDVVRKDRYGIKRYEENIYHDYKNNTRSGTVKEGVKKTRYEESASNTGGPIDTRVSEKLDYRGMPTREKTVHVDKNLDGRYDYSEKVETYKYNDTTVRRKDMNNWNLFGKKSYYDNTFNYLGGSYARLRQHVEQRGNNITSTFTPVDKNQKVSITLHYTNQRGIDVHRDPKALNDERPSHITFKTTKDDGTVIEKTGFPGTTENHITHVNQKRNGWEKDVTHTHLMDRNNPKKVNMRVTELSANEANKYSIEWKAKDIGIKKLPPKFKEFIDSAGSKVNVSMREEKDEKTGKVKRSMICVDPETGNRFVLNEDGGKTNSYYKDAKNNKEYLDMGEAAIEKVGSKFVIYEKDRYGRMVKKKEGDFSEYMGEGSSFGITRTGTKGVRKASTDAMSLFAALGKASKTLRAGNRATGQGISGNIANFLGRHGVKNGFLRHIDKANVGLGSLVTTCTVLDIMDKGKDVGGTEIATLVGDVADLGADASKLNFVKNTATKFASRSGGAGASKLTTGLKVGGKVLGVIGAGANLVSAGFNVYNGEYVAAGLDVMAAAGSAIGLFAGSTSWAGPVGWGIAAVGIAGSLIYYNVKANEIHTLGEAPLEKEYYMRSQLYKLERNLER